MARNQEVNFQEELTEETRKLRQEFRAIDIDGDGRVDKYEMDIYLRRKGVDEEHR
jgi:Ca2+-binding EF-hand superfamily protein